jgi:hypothetical protein
MGRLSQLRPTFDKLLRFLQHLQWCVRREGLNQYLNSPCAKFQIAFFG